MKRKPLSKWKGTSLRGGKKRKKNCLDEGLGEYLRGKKKKKKSCYLLSKKEREGALKQRGTETILLRKGGSGV